MARVYSQKSRKIRKCQKCGREILPGDVYFSAQPYGRREMIRCISCKPERSELTGSDYLAWLYNLQDHLTELYDLTSADSVDELISELEGERDNVEENLNNMPEQLQDGCILQERIEALESAIDELGELEFPEYDEDNEAYQVEDDEPLCYSVELNEAAQEEFCDFEELIRENYMYVNDIIEETYGFVQASGEFDEEEGGTLVYVNKKNADFKLTLTFERRSNYDEDLYLDAVDEYAGNVESIVSSIE